MNYLTIVDDKIIIEAGGRIVPIGSVADLYAFEDDNRDEPLYKSSCIDFPEDSTSDPDTIAIARAITA